MFPPDIAAQSRFGMPGGEGAPRMPASQPTPRADCAATRHWPTREHTDPGGIRRARCRCCGLQLMRTAISRRWIIADQLG